MSVTLKYCPNLDTVISRLKRFFSGSPEDMILCRMNTPGKAALAYREKWKPGYCDYPDPVERAKFWDACLAEHTEVFDDTVPGAYLSEMDQGLYGGLLGGKERFLFDPDTGWLSSMVEPIIGDLSEVKNLRFGTDNAWWERYTTHLEAFIKVAEGKFGISHFILINGLNFIYELVGATQTYIELMDRPELVRQAMELGFQVNLKVQQEFFRRAPLLEGGTFSMGWQWIPGRILAESVDPFHMARVDCFEEWGRVTLERIFSYFDGGVIHIHGNGRHLLKATSTVRGLKAIALGDDHGYPSAFDILGDIRGQVGSMPLSVNVDYQKFIDALSGRKLIGGVMYSVTGVPDTDTANRCMDRVRNYHPG